MRILGYLFMAFGVLAAGAMLIWGHAGLFKDLRVVILASGIVAFGWRLTKPRRKLTATPEAVRSDGAPTRADLVEGTFELPMTPEVEAALSEAARSARRKSFQILAGSIVAGQLFGLIAYYLSSPRELLNYYIGVTFATVIGLSIGLLSLVVSARMRRDLNSRTFLRTTGPIEVVPVSNSYTLRMVGRSFGLEQKAAPALKDLDWASIDYGPLGHVILQVRNRDGETVYRAQGCSVASLRAAPDPSGD